MDFYDIWNKTKSLKSCERGELKSKIWMIIKVVWWLKSIDDKVLLTNKLTMDNAISRVAFATENY